MLVKHKQYRLILSRKFATLTAQSLTGSEEEAEEEETALKSEADDKTVPLQRLVPKFTKMTGHHSNIG